MKNIFLIGYMGVGKTTVGKLLSAELGMEFIDLDKYIEKRYRKSIPELFEKKGEAGFRKIECEMLREIATFQNVLISTGGGAPCFFDNMDLMNRMGVTIYIKASVDQLVSRLLSSKNVRPLVQNKTPEELREFVEQHLAQRENYYAKAMIIYENKQLVSRAHVSETVDAIKEMIQAYIRN